MKDLIVFGASGFGREVAWIVERINTVLPTWNLVGFMDDNSSILNKSIGKYKVIGSKKDVLRYPEAFFVCAVGASKIRKNIVNSLKRINPDINFATLIDPSAELSDSVKIGAGSIVCAHTIITVDVNIGDHVVINLDCTIGHDAVLQNFVTLYPSVNVSGMANIGLCCELGTGMQIIQGKTIGDYSIIGAGAVVVKDIPSKCTAVGSPAKPIKFFD